MKGASYSPLSSFGADLTGRQMRALYDMPEATGGPRGPAKEELEYLSSDAHRVHECCAAGNVLEKWGHRIRLFAQKRNETKEGVFPCTYGW
jgi:hypothetical protein